MSCLIIVTLMCLSCEKEKKKEDLTRNFVGAYVNQNYQKIKIYPQDSLQTMGISGLTISPVSAIVTDENNFQIAPSIVAKLPVYSGGGCGWCLNDDAHLLKMTGWGLLNYRELTITTNLYKKYENDQDFSFYTSMEYKLTRVN
ncbi:MAG: hypothetical protein IPM74_02430 [Crocinitomicaceae bacterium]|nr:hypothetical protein [Crocinitomicaceae bacterium]MBK8924773.1 hypothetical protein [Crocinitomicaceae bacterium]